MPRDGDLLLRRDRDLAGRRDGKRYGDLVKTFNEIRRGFEDQADRCDDIDDNWDAYHCIIGGNQVYHGNTEYYVPIVRNAVRARKTRFLNQIFPASGRYIDATSSDGSVPHAQVALIEHYIRRAELKTQIVAALLLNGDLEGQYNLLVDWDRYERHVVSRETRSPEVELPGMPAPAEVEGEEISDLKFESIADAGPCFEVIRDTDTLIQPVTSEGVEDALHRGGQVTVIRRWTKETLEDLIDKKEVRRAEAEQLLEMSTREDVWKDGEKSSIDAAGIKKQGRFFLVYKTWKVLETEEGRRLCEMLYGGYGMVLAAKRIRYWNDRCPLLSKPVDKISGMAKGVPPVNAIMSHQLHANDVANEAADAMTLSMLPIVIVDPAKSGRTNFIINLGAVWEIDPTSIKFAEFPKLWQDAIPAIQADTQLAFQTLGVNPAMLPQQTGRPGAKRNQAEVALEQTVDLLTTSEACSVIEEGVMTPAMERAVEYDQQFRDDELTVRSFGELGVVARMERVPPLQTGTRYYFTWFGVEQARNAAQQQQQIAFLNVARGLSQDLARNGYMLNPAPALEHAAGNIFGWRMGRQIVVDARSSLAMNPELENELMKDGFFVPVHPLDQDPQHIQSHMRAQQMTGDPSGEIRTHIQRHMAQMQMKAAMMARQQMGGQQQPGQPGAPGGGPTPPAQGAQPQGPKLVRGPAGAIHPDVMPRAGAAVMPRKM